MGLVAIGVTLLMICGEFDLSVGSVFALTPMIMAVLLEGGTPFALAFHCGPRRRRRRRFRQRRRDDPVQHSELHHHARHAVHSPVDDRGDFRRFSAFASPTNLPNWLFTVFVGPGDLFRMSFFWFVGIALMTVLLLSQTNFGNWVRATGGFLPAASSMGIPTARVKMACFMICSMLAGFAGMIQVLRLGTPLPSIGEGMELQAVAAAVIGGTALTGGVGTILGGIIGATLIRVIDNGLVLSQVDANWFKFAIGFLTIFAVVANAWLRRRARFIKVET